MAKQFLTNIIGEDYRNWKKGETVLITAGTGAGKTSFVKNKLNLFCCCRDEKILFLSNRTNLRKQTENDVEALARINFNQITIKNYQEVEAICRTEKYDLSQYDVIVMDEAHYFFTDSAFNNKTDLFLREVIGDNNVIKVFMTATPIILKGYLKQHSVNIDYLYELKTDYSYLDNVIAYNNKDSALSIINEIPQDEQIIYFGSVKRALEISQTFDGAFICSQHNKDYYKKYVAGTENEEELNRIITNQKFNNHILCTTIALDNGVNISEESDVKHIIIEVSDVDTFVQCLGRRRIKTGDKINLYFYDYSNKQEIAGYRTKLLKPLAEADFLIDKGELEYVKAYNKQHKTGIVDFVIGKDGYTHAQLNECKYYKYIHDVAIYDAILDKNTLTNYKDIIGNILNVNVISKEADEIKSSTEIYLDTLVGKPLYKEEQKQLAEKLNIRRNGKLLKSISTLNSYFEEVGLNYLIKSERKSYRDKDGKIKKQPTSWVVYSLNINVDEN